jgi:uncharacterized iron-regulated protein
MKNKNSIKLIEFHKERKANMILYIKELQLHLDSYCNELTEKQKENIEKWINYKKSILKSDYNIEL